MSRLNNFLTEKRKIMKLYIDSSKCTGSGECMKVCPHKAITLVNGRAVIDVQICDLDGICIPACPHSAITYDEEDT